MYSVLALVLSLSCGMNVIEINEAVARKLGWDKCAQNGKIGLAYGWRRDPSRHFHEALPDYCGSIQAAWEIVDYFINNNINCGLRWVDGQWDFWYKDKTNTLPEVRSDTAPLAICLAFLKLDISAYG